MPSKILMIWLACLVMNPLANGSAMLSESDAQRIFSNLVKAAGYRNTSPKLSIRPISEVAQYDAVHQMVTISPSLLDFAATFDREAETVMALILAHELAHHFENHNLKTTSLGFATPEQTAYKDFRRYEMEKEADFFAVFYAYMAGYRTENMDGTFLKKLYEYFDIKNDKHYPTLGQRTGIYQEAAAKIGELVNVFEAGNLLLLLDEPVAAAHCFEQVGVHFTSPEVWNNAGAAYLRSALKLLTEDHPAFHLLFPVEFEDGMTAMGVRDDTRQGALSPEEIKSLRLSYLLKAKESLEKSLAAADTMETALVNLTSVCLLLAQEKNPESQERLYFGLLAQQTLALLHFFAKNKPHLSCKIEVLQGIQSYLEGNTPAAKSIFQSAVERCAPALAARNLAAVSGEEVTLVPPINTSAAFEKVNGIILQLPEGREQLTGLVSDETPVVVKGWSYELTIRRRNLDEAQAFLLEYFLFDESTASRFYVLKTSRNNEKSVLGLKQGDPLQSVIEKYGLPAIVTLSRQTTYLTYPGTGVFFAVKNGKVSSFYTFFKDD